MLIERHVHGDRLLRVELTSEAKPRQFVFLTVARGRQNISRPVVQSEIDLEIDLEIAAKIMGRTYV